MSDDVQVAYKDCSNIDPELLTRCQTLLLEQHKWDIAYTMIINDVSNKHPNNEINKIKNYLEILCKDEEQIEVYTFNWETDSYGSERKDFIILMNKFNALMEEESGYILRYKKLKEIFSYDRIKLY